MKNTVDFKIFRNRENIVRAGRNIWGNFNRNHGLLWATSLTYTTLFALVPLLAVALSLFKAFGGFEDIQQNVLLPAISDLLDPTHKIKVMLYIQGYVDKINAGALGIIGTTVFILAFVPLFIGMETAINTIWGKEDDRPIWNKFIVYWAVTTLGPMAIVLTISLVSLFNEFIPGLKFLQSMRPMVVVYIMFALFLIYKLVPNTDVDTLPAFAGALSGGVLWVIANFGYQAYMKYATTSFSIYGSLGAIPVFLLWIYINWVILLAGVQISKFVQYPVYLDKDIESTPYELLKASVEMLGILFGGITAGTYLTEKSLCRKTGLPPEITSTVISSLMSSRILVYKGDIILPLTSPEELELDDLVKIFVGDIEEGKSGDLPFGIKDGGHLKFRDI